MEAEKRKINMSADLGPGEALPGSQWASSHYVLTGGRDEGAIWNLLYKGTNPIHEGSTLHI